MRWMVVLTVLAAGLVLLALALVSYGHWRWQRATRALLARLEAGRVEGPAGRFDGTGLADLPGPVQRYLRQVVPVGQPAVVALTLEQAGTFSVSETTPRWLPFTALQRTIVDRPGFVWDARIRMGPGLTVRVHDAYVAGEGVLHAALAGVFTLARQQPTRELAHGELLRWLAETPLYPTALLPGRGVEWTAIDERRATATVTDGGLTAALEFRFSHEGLVEEVHAAARGRTVGDAVVPTPWTGRWWNYQPREGVLVPTEGEVAWQLPAGPLPYWRGVLTRMTFEWAGR